MQSNVIPLMRRATRWLGSFVLMGVCTLALALPSPKDIEAAVNAGRLTQAETMLREVLQDKPGSARAHYELGQVLARQAKYDEALAEVQRAKSIDSSLKFAASPEKFQQTLDRIGAAASTAKLPSATAAANLAATVAPAPAPPPAAAPASAALNLNYVLLGIGVLLLVAFLVRRNKAQATPANMGYAPSAPAPAAPILAGSSGFGAQFTPNAPAYPGGPAAGHAPGYAPRSGPGYGAPMQGGGIGSGMGGAVLGGVAGLAAGYALSKAFEGDHQTGANQGAHAAADNGAGYVPFDAPAQPELGNFDAGSGDSWDAQGDGGSDDNW